MRRGSAAMTPPLHIHKGNTDMDTDTRIECTNWDDEVAVATWTKGRTRKPARKVITRGVAKVELTRGQTSRITKMLGSGMEVRLDFGGDGAIRLYPCAAADFRTMFVAADTMGEFRHAVYRGRNLAFTSRRGRRSVSREEVEERVENCVGTGPWKSTLFSGLSLLFPTLPILLCSTSPSCRGLREPPAVRRVGDIPDRVRTRRRAPQ